MLPDSNGDGRHDLSDAVFVLNFLFTGGKRRHSQAPRNAASDRGIPRLRVLSLRAVGSGFKTISSIARVLPWV